MVPTGFPDNHASVMVQVAARLTVFARTCRDEQLPLVGTYKKRRHP